MGRSRRVLVIEKDLQTLGELAESLEFSGFDVTKVSESDEALRHATRGSFDAALLNFRMPGLSGLDLLRPLKGRTPVVVFSPEISDATRDRALQEGAATVVSGPVIYSEILGALHAALNPETVGPRALVVDDHEGSRSHLAEVLQEEGYRVITAKDGREALEKAVCSPVPYNLCITDVVMPGLGGAELIKQIHEIHPTTQIVCTTGSASRDEIRRCYAAGAGALWLKPFDREKLLASLQELKKASQRPRRKTLVLRSSWVNRFRHRLERDKGKKAFLRGTWQLLVMALLLASVVGTVLYFKGYLSAPVRRVEGFMHRMEGYLERDETREIDRERERKR